jgi:glutamate-1-semialdehyde 2,1-aminomutase
MNFEKSNMLKKKSHALIPGGCHTYAKGDDQYPELSPGFIVKGKGCHVWDADGNEFIEYGMGLRSVTLGHSFSPVIEAASKQMNLGNNFVRPSPIEIECAEEFLSMITGAEMVKFAKNGSDATDAAAKLARAYTGRDLIAICADHPFFSVSDWFIGTTPMTAGIPQAVRSLTVKFRYNDIESAKSLFEKYSSQIACVVLEPEKDTAPANNFLHELQKLCKKNDSVFILDEMITGFRWNNGGGQAYHHIIPDLSAFGKAMGNGFSIAALAGKREIMELGGISHDHERVFLLSLTHGAENHSLAAAKKVMQIYKKEPVVETLWNQGERLAQGIQKSIDEYRLDGYFAVLGRPCCLIYGTRDYDKQPSQPFRTLFLQELIKRGILAPSLTVSYSHTDEDIDKTIEAVHESLHIYRKALNEGIEKFLIGKPVKPVIRKYCHIEKNTEKKPPATATINKTLPRQPSDGSPRSPLIT